MQGFNISLDSIQNLQKPLSDSFENQTTKAQNSPQSSSSFLDLVKSQSSASVETKNSFAEKDSLQSEQNLKASLNKTDNAESESGSKKDEQKIAENNSDEEEANSLPERLKKLALKDSKNLNSSNDEFSESDFSEKLKDNSRYSVLNQLVQKNKDLEVEKTEATKSLSLNELLKNAEENVENNLVKNDENVDFKLSAKKIKDLASDDVLAAQAQALQNNASTENVGILQSTNQNAFDDENSLLKIDGANKKTLKIGEKASFTVTDLRTQQDQDSLSENIAEKVKGSSKPEYSTSIKYYGDNEMQLTFDMNQTQANQNILSSNSQAASANGSNFQAMLENMIQDNATDFAKAGSIVLKDNNVGSISLVLHPESLGNVKINLEMTDKIITGHITVNSKEAMAAFESNIQSLKNAFAQNGFESASFDLSMAGQNAGENGSGNQSDSRQMQQMADKLYGDYTETSPAAISETDLIENDNRYSVNIVA